VNAEAVIRSAEVTREVLARIEERHRWSVDVPEFTRSLDAFAGMVERLGTALTVSLCLPPEPGKWLDGDR
jgi:hypothetical protein